MVNIGNTTVDIYLRTLCHLPETAVLTAFCSNPRSANANPILVGLIFIYGANLAAIFEAVIYFVSDSVAEVLIGEGVVGSDSALS